MICYDIILPFTHAVKRKWGVMVGSEWIHAHRHTNSFITAILDVFSSWLALGENSQQPALILSTTHFSISTSPAPAHQSQICTRNRPRLPGKLKGLLA